MNKEFVREWDDSATPQAAAASRVNAGPKASVVALKQIVTIRLDVDTLEWFKSGGPGYQTRINQLLREHMDAQRAAGKQA